MFAYNLNYLMDGFEVYALMILLVLITWAVLNIILFFKIWGMTNNVKRIMEFQLFKSGYDPASQLTEVVAPIDSKE